nr:hypothetical protein BaRGS_024706 [Batillaria attramentaria]
MKGQAHLLYACTAEGHVYLLNTDNLDATHVITEVGNEINCMDFSMDGYTFATSGKSLDVHIYQTKSNKLMRKYEGNRGTRGNPDLEGGNTMRVFALKYTPHNENVFISAGWDNHIKV